MEDFELADDEKEAFLNHYAGKIFYKKKPVEEPSLIVVLGQSGSGKSRLCQSMDNFVHVSPDDIQQDYYEQIGVDLRGDLALRVTEKEDEFFGIVVSNLVTYALENRYNIVFESADIESIASLEVAQEAGYKTGIKAVIGDRYTNFLNTMERKLDADENYTKYKEGEEPYIGLSFIQVPEEDAFVSADETLALLNRIDKKGKKVEVYISGEDTPAFITGNGKWSFKSFMTGDKDGSFKSFMDKREPEKFEKHYERIKGLKERAVEQGNEDIFFMLKNLEKELGNIDKQGKSKTFEKEAMANAIKIIKMNKR